MKIYRLHRKQALGLSAEDAWLFLSSPSHLNEITPDFFQVAIRSPLPEDIYAGLLIEYGMTAVCGIPMTWLSEISQCDRPRRFVYKQLVGPFKFLSHEVCLTETATGIILEDILVYAMPLGWLGRGVNRLLIGARLERIFDTRRDYLAARWG